MHTKDELMQLNRLISTKLVQQTDPKPVFVPIEVTDPAKVT